MVLAAVLPVVLATAGGAPRLPQLLGRSRLVVDGTVAAVDVYEGARLAVARVRPVRVLKGSAEGDVAVVERRDLPSAPDLFVPGERVLVFLETAPRVSSLVRSLPPERYFEPSGGREGVVRGAPDEVREVADAVERLVAASRAPETDPARRAAEERARVFAEIAGRHPLLVADGAARLPDLRDLPGTLTDAERRTLEAAVRRGDLPGWVRVGLVEAIGAADLRGLAPVIRDLGEADAHVLEASWATLRRLGQPLRARELSARLSSEDPAVRAAAARALAASGEAGTVARVERLALTDDDQSVRSSAAEALAEAPAKEALAALERIFPRADWPTRQAAGRAIVRLGGRPAQEALARLAFRGPRDVQTYAVTLLMVSGIGLDDPLLQRIRSSHPDEQVRHLAREGFPRHEH